MGVWITIARHRFVKQCALSCEGCNCFDSNFVKENALTKTKLRAYHVVALRSRITFGVSTGEED